MRRRDFIKVIAGSATTWPLAAGAQQTGQPRRIGLLMLYPEKDPQGELRARVFQNELEKAGWTVGGNLQINFHWGRRRLGTICNHADIGSSAGRDASQRRRGGEGGSAGDSNGSRH